MRRSFDWTTMGPIPCPHQVFHTAPVRVGTSTAQASLARIIAIISTVSPPRIEAARAGRLGCGIDLNLRLGPPLEIGGGSSGNEEEKEERGWGPTSQSGAVVDVVAEPLESGEEPTVDKGWGKTSPAVEKSSTIWPAVRSSEGECDLEKESRKEAAEGAKESSGITRKADGDNEEEEKQQDEESQDTKGGASEEGQHKDAMRNLRKGNGSEGYLDLLLEAVRQVSGELFDEKLEKEKEKKAADDDDEEEEEEEERAPKRRAARVAQGSKRRGSERLPFDLYVDSAPIVRSKRGRSQTLPSRYRDSILDPWRKLPTITRHGRGEALNPPGELIVAFLIICSGFVFLLFLLPLSLSLSLI